MKWQCKSVEYIIPKHLVSPCKGINFKSIQVEQPRYGTAAHTTAPAINKNNFCVRIFAIDMSFLFPLLQDYFSLLHHLSHFGSEIIQPDFDGFFTALLLVIRTYHFSFFIGKKWKRERS